MAINPDIKRGLHRNFQRYTHYDRARMQASHRLGHQQREQIGEVFWTHESIRGRAFDTRKQAVVAASRKLGIPAYDTDGASSVSTA